MGEGVRLSVTHILYDPFFGTGKEGMMGDTLLLVGLNKNGLVVSVSPSTGGSFSLALTWHVPRGEELELRVCDVDKRTSSYPFLKKHNLLKTCYPLPTHHPSHPSMAIFPPFLTSPLDDRICLKHNMQHASNDAYSPTVPLERGPIRLLAPSAKSPVTAVSSSSFLVSSRLLN